MSLFGFLTRGRSSAPVARDRLQVLLAELTRLIDRGPLGPS